MQTEQKLSTGILVRQNISNSVRLALFETGLQEFPYGTHGGVITVVAYQGKPYGITCGHVFRDFQRHQLVVMSGKQSQKGAPLARLKSVAFPSSLRESAAGTDIDDVCVLEFKDDVGADFFKDDVYVIDPATIGTSKKGHKLSAAGTLIEKINLAESPMHGGYCRLEFQDNGPSSFDPTMRHGIAKFEKPEFSNLTGLSGAPVFDETSKVLCGMVVRAGLKDGDAQIHFIDMYDIVTFLHGVHAGEENLFYNKVVAYSPDQKRPPV
jgi:hypothetical protein